MVELIVWLLHMEQMNPVGVANQLKLLNSDTTEFCATRHLLGGDSLSPKKVGNYLTPISDAPGSFSYDSL